MSASPAPAAIPAPEPEDAADRAGLDEFARRGDRAAIERLFRRHAETMWRVAARHAGSAAADDAVQEAFVAAMRQAATFRGSGSATVRGWLLALAANAGRMQARSAARRAQREQAAVPPEPPSEPGSGPDRDLVASALAALPAGERLAVVLHHADGLAHAEVAQALACSVVAARKRVQRGLVRMRAFLARRGVTCTAGALSVAVGQCAVLAHSATAAEIGAACAASGPLSQAPSWWVLAGQQGALAAKVVGATVLAKAGVAGVLAACLVLGVVVATADPPLPPLGAAVIAPAVDPVVQEAVATPVRLDLRRHTLAEAIALVRLQVRVRVTWPEELGYREDGSPIFITLRCADTAEAALSALAREVGAELVLAGDACHLIVRQDPEQLAQAASDLQSEDPARWPAARAALVRGHDPSGLAHLALHDLRRERAAGSVPEALQIVIRGDDLQVPGDPWSTEDPWARWRRGALAQPSAQASEVHHEALALIRLAPSVTEVRQAVREVLAHGYDETALWVGAMLGMAELQPLLQAQVERGRQAPDFWQVLRHGLRPQQRAEKAITLLGLLGSAAEAPARLRALVPAMAEPWSPDLRRAACAALGRSGDPAALPVLSASLPRMVRSDRFRGESGTEISLMQRAIAELGRRPALRTPAARVWMANPWYPPPSIPRELLPEVLGMIPTIKPHGDSLRALAAALGPWSDLPEVRQAILAPEARTVEDYRVLSGPLANLPDADLALRLIRELDSFPDLRRVGPEQFGRFVDVLELLAATSQPQALVWITHELAKQPSARAGGPPFVTPAMPPWLLVRALGSLRTPAAEEALRGLLEQPDPPGAGELAPALVAVRSTLQPTLMRQCLAHPAAWVRQGAVDLVRESFPPAEALALGERLMQDPDTQVRARALVQLVGWLHPDDHQRNLALIAQGLADPQVEIRRSAAQALFNPQRAPYVPLALTALSDSDDQVKQAAALALAALASRRPEVPGLQPYRKQVQAALKQVHSSATNDLRREAARALVEWGGDDPQPEAQSAAAQPAALAPRPEPVPLAVPSPTEPHEAPARDGGGF